MPSFGVMLSGSARVWCAALILLVGSSLRAEMPDLKGTMPEDSMPGLKRLLDLAGQQSQGVLFKYLELEQADAGVVSARSRMLPSLGANFNYGISQSADSNNPNSRAKGSGFYYALNVNQSLFTEGDNKRALDSARLRQAVTQLGLDETRRVLFAAVRGQYLLLVAAKMSLAQGRVGLDLAKRDAANVRKRFEDGIVSAGEVNNREDSLARIQLEFDRSQERYDQSRRTLARLVGIDELPDAEVEVGIPAPRATIETGGLLVAEVLRSGGKNTISAEIAEMRVRDADLNYRSQQFRLWPKFSMSATQQVQNSTNVNGNSVSQTALSTQSAAIGGSWSLWDGFATRAAKKDALANKRSNERQLKNLTSQTMEDVFGLQKRYEFATRDLAFVERSEATVRGVLANVEDDLKHGTVARNAYDNALRDVGVAEAATAAARASYFSAWCDLVSAAGADPLTKFASQRHGR